MEFTDYMLWKALAIVALAFLYGVWRGATERTDTQRPKAEPLDKRLD
jgi:hypothetical protein